MATRVKSKSWVRGAGISVVVALVILAACYGLKAIGDNRNNSASSRGAAAADLDFFDSDYCGKSLQTRFSLQNVSLPFDVQIGSVVDVDSFDWCNSADGSIKFLPSDSVNDPWGLVGLRLASGTQVLRGIDPRVTSSGSPFTVFFVDANGQQIGVGSFDVRSNDGERGAVVFRGDEYKVLTDYDTTRVIGAVNVGDRARTVTARLVSSSSYSMLMLELG